MADPARAIMLLLAVLGSAAPGLSQPARRVSDDPALSSRPGRLTPYGARLLFTENRGGPGTNLWVTGGSSETTVKLENGVFAEIAVAGAKILYPFSTPAAGTELFMSDGTPGSGALLKDIRPGTASSSPNSLTACGSRVVFATSASFSMHNLLHASDGTTEGTTLLKTIEPQSTPLFPGSPVVLGDFQGAGGRVSFFLRSTLIGFIAADHWETDGTEAGTNRITGGAGARASITLRSTLPSASSYCYAFTMGLVTETYTIYWRYDGTGLGTTRLSQSEQPYQNDPGDMAMAHDQLFFTATSNATGLPTLWKSSLSGPPVSEVLAIAARDLIEFRGELFFQSPAGDLWASDGTALGTRLIRAIAPGGAAPAAPREARRTIAIGGALLFTADDGTSGTELWISDGTEEGTTLLQDLNPGGGSSSPDDFLIVEDKLFFTADGGPGAKLWVLDLEDIPGAHSAARDWAELP